jgi:hypothetical protein
MKNIKRMKAIVLTMTMALVMVTGNLKAQYDEDKYGIQPWFGGSSLLNKESEPMRPEGESIDLTLPLLHGDNADSPATAPVGSGIAILATLGAAYLIGKKRNEE